MEDRAKDGFDMGRAWEGRYEDFLKAERGQRRALCGGGTMGVGSEDGDDGVRGLALCCGIREELSQGIAPLRS